LLKRRNFSTAICVGFRPGVKDNVGDTSKKALEELLGKNWVETFILQTLLAVWKISRQDTEKIAKELANELIEKSETKTSSEFGEQDLGRLCQRFDHWRRAGEGIDMNLPDRKLIALSKQRLLALTLDEMR